MPHPIVCLYLVGDSRGTVRERFGSFTDWFGRLFAEHRVRVRAFDGTTGRLPDDRDEVSGYVITGSAASLTEPEPWMDAAVALIREAHATRTPLLGVCFGHQLIGRAFGGSVVRNPAGWQLRTGDVEITDDGRGDPLFSGLPRRIAVNFSHQDVVDDSVAGRGEVRVLARNVKAGVAAVAVGEHIRGVQFHPEFSGEVTRAYIDSRRQTLVDESEERGVADDHPDRLLAVTRETPDGRRVFHNFLSNFVLD